MDWSERLRRDPLGFREASLKLERGARIDLRGADLAGRDLRGLGVRSWDLTGADLTRAQVQASFLQRCRLQHTELRDVVWEGDPRVVEPVLALWAGPDAWAVWRASHTAYTLDEVDLSGAQLQGFDLSQIHWLHARLEAADLRNSKLDGAKLSGACLQGACLDRLKIHEVDLRGAQFAGASLVGVEVTRSTFESAELRDVSGSSSHWSDVNATRWVADGAVLAHAHFENSLLDATSWRGAHMHEVWFSRCSLVRAAFEDAEMSEAQVVDCVSAHVSPAGFLDAYRPRENSLG